MAKRSLQSALARKEPTPPLELTSPAPAEKPAKAPDTRLVTSVRMDPELMIRLKAQAVRERARLNDLIVMAIENYLTMKEQGRA
jgi:hypothetical protein